MQRGILFSFMVLTTTKINDRNDVEEENTVCDVWNSHDNGNQMHQQKSL